MIPTHAQAAYPAGDNGLIAFGRYEGEPWDGQSDVWISRADGSGQRNLTRTPGFDELNAAFSPDGRRIIFVRLESGCWLCIAQDLYMMRPDGTGLRKPRLQPYGIPRHILPPAFAPDGRVFTSFGIYWFTSRLDGTRSSPTGLSYQDDVHSPRYSPDGRRIYYYRWTQPPYELPQNFDVVTTRPGRFPSVTPITHTGPGISEINPEPAPDGQHLLFYRNVYSTRDGYRPSADVEGLWTVDLRDGTETKLLDDAGPGVYSPDGSQIAFTGCGDECTPYTANGLYVANADGSARRMIATGRITEVSWQRISTCRDQRVTITGGDGPDRIQGTRHPDVIMGFGGRDRVLGRGGNDVICGGQGRDMLVGGKGEDTLMGGHGKDRAVQ